MRSFLNQPRVLIFLALMAAGSLRICSTYNIFSHTVDEPAHLACGMEWLDHHTFTLEPKHPPLARIFMAIGPYLAGERSQPQLGEWMDGFRILGREAHYDRILALARLGILPFFWITAFAVYVLTRRLATVTAALAAVLILTTSPSVLAHAGLATNDLCLTAMIALSTVAILWWMDRPNYSRSFALGICLALTVISKMSSVVYLPAVLLTVTLWRIPLRAIPLKAIRAGVPILLVSLSVLFTLWAAYCFSIGREPFFHQRVPFPELWIGLQDLVAHNTAGTGAYLCGVCTMGGIWYYFPVALFFKTPLPLLLLLGIAAFLFLKGYDRRGFALPFSIAAAILLIAAFSRINIGTRHVLPAIPMLAVAAGIALNFFLAHHRKAAVSIAAFLLIWYVGEGVAVHPDYLAYTNEFTGSHPERFLVDSDLDWGQDLKRLRHRLEGLGVKRVSFLPFGIGYFLAGNAFPTLLPANLAHPARGWNAVSLTVWKLSDTCPIDGKPPAREWPDFYAPKERVGKSIFLYYFP